MLRGHRENLPPIASLWLTKCDVSINIKKGIWTANAMCKTALSNQSAETSHSFGQARCKHSIHIKSTRIGNKEYFKNQQIEFKKWRDLAMLTSVRIF